MLKLVEAQEAPFTPVLLSTQQLVHAYWPQAAELLRPCVEDAMHGELTLDDIYQALLDGRMVALVFKRDTGEVPEVALAMVFEAISYPQYAVVNIVALGGEKLAKLRDMFWGHVCSWAYLNGAKYIQASVSPAMARLLKEYGFLQIYVTLRLDLAEM